MPVFRPDPTESDEHTAKYRNWDEIEREEQVSPYVDLIQRDPVVCDTCFLLRYDVLSCEWWRGEFGWSDYNRWIPIHGRSEEIPGGTSARGTRLVCKNCGTANEQQRPIPRSDLLGECVDNLSTTLRTKGIKHDAERLFLEVKERSGNPENQGKQDSAVLSPAVHIAIQSVQGPHGHGTAASIGD